jgi:hypothetical protein
MLLEMTLRVLGSTPSMLPRLPLLALPKAMSRWVRAGTCRVKSQRNCVFDFAPHYILNFAVDVAVRSAFSGDYCCPFPAPRSQESLSVANQIDAPLAATRTTCIGVPACRLPSLGVEFEPRPPPKHRSSNAFPDVPVVQRLKWYWSRLPSR